MLIKLEGRIEALKREGKIKSKWSRIEDLGIAELVHHIFDCDPVEDSIATAAIVEDNTIFLHLWEGIIYEHEGEMYNLARAYIDIESNIIFETPKGELFLYEMEIIDAEDPKHYYGNE